MKAKSDKSFGVRKSDMASPETKKEWANRRVDKMFEGHGEANKRRAKGKSAQPKQAVKLPGKMGPSERNGGTDKPKTRKTDKQSRTDKLKSHFKSILTGKAGKMQGKK